MKAMRAVSQQDVPWVRTQWWRSAFDVPRTWPAAGRRGRTLRSGGRRHGWSESGSRSSNVSAFPSW